MAVPLVSVIVEYSFLCTVWFWLRGTDDVRTFLEDAEDEIEIPVYNIPA